MIDPIGTRPSPASGARSSTVKAVGGAVKAAPTPAVADSAAPAPPSVQAAVKEMAAQPPIDQERVEIIRTAIAHGRFPITPATIADRLIAFAQGWRPA